MNNQHEEPLTGGFITSSVTRLGDTVRRSAGEWTPATHAWLRHLATAEPAVAPRPIHLDTDAGVEIISFLAGTVLSGGASPPQLWLDDTLAAVAKLVRRFHDATHSFVLPPNARWQRTAADPEGAEVICHNDLAPWNTVFSEETPVAFIDWDLAAPGRRVWDVAYTLWHFVPLYGDAGSDPFDTMTVEPRARRSRLFCDAYGLDDRTDVVDVLLSRQLAALAALEDGVKAGDPAYERLWSLGAGDGVIRQINYVHRNRAELNHALA